MCRATTGSPSRPRVRIVKGSRKAGRNSEMASDDVCRQQEREQARRDAHAAGRSTSRATQSVSCSRPTMRRPAAAKAGGPRARGRRRCPTPAAGHRCRARRRRAEGPQRAPPRARREGWPRGWRGRGRRARSAIGQAAPGRLDGDPVASGVLTRRLDGDGVRVDGGHATGSQQGGRDGQDARTRPDVEHRRATDEPAHPPSARGPRGRAASWGAGQCRRPCPGRGPRRRRRARARARARSA